MGIALPCARARTTDLEGFALDPRADEWAEFRGHYPRCLDCSRELSRLAALIGALGLEPHVVSAHLADPELLALATAPERLAGEERERIELHLAGCAPCRMQRNVLERFDFTALAGEAEAEGLLARLLGALGRIAALVPLPRPVLAALLALLVVAPMLLVWRAGSDREAPAPQLARVEPQATAAPTPIEPARPQESAPPAARPPSPPPPEPAKPVAQKPPAATPAPMAPARKPAAEAPPAPAPVRPLEIAALISTDAPIYVAGAFGGGSVRIGGASRGAADGPAPQALAPEHVGRTSHESPTLYWFLPSATPLSAELTLVDPNGVEPLLETTLPGPLAAGFHAVPLSKHGVKLASGVDYQWFVALIVDPARRARDVVSGGSIRRAPAAAEVAAAPPAQLAHAYAEAGLWYDAFDQLSVWLAAEPDAKVLHAHRAALLEQVGLSEAARYERGQSAGQ